MVWRKKPFTGRRSWIYILLREGGTCPSPRTESLLFAGQVGWDAMEETSTSVGIVLTDAPHSRTQVLSISFKLYQVLEEWLKWK
jgi:hypothetical protein